MEKNCILKVLKERLANATCWNEKQKAYHREIIKVARPVKCVPAADVLDEYQLEYVKRYIVPEARHCYRNACLLAEAFPDILYVEGMTAVPFDTEHAFNKVGDQYIDITFEFALGEDPRKFPYISIAEYDSVQVDEFVRQTGGYGEFYRFNWWVTKELNTHIEL